MKPKTTRMLLIAQAKIDSHVAAPAVEEYLPGEHLTPVFI